MEEVVITVLIIIKSKSIKKIEQQICLYSNRSPICNEAILKIPPLHLFLHIESSEK